MTSTWYKHGKLTFMKHKSNYIVSSQVRTTRFSHLNGMSSHIYRPTLFFTIFVQHIALAAATGKSCLQCFANFTMLFTQNWISTQFLQTNAWGSLYSAFGEGVHFLNPSLWPLPVSQNLDPPLVIVIMNFKIKVRKTFIGVICTLSF